MSHLVKFIQECHNNLLTNHSDEVDRAIIYLKKRHLTLKTIEYNNIGYCLRDQYIPDEIKYYGKEEDEERSFSGYSYFIAGRIVVPVYSEFGIAVGLATRAPSFEEGNTWWNLPKPFYKGNHLFLLNRARKEIFRKNKAIIVEGYIDAIKLNQEGLHEVVALMGTQLSPRKIGLLARYCDNICICLDVDANQSGQVGQEKVIYALKEYDFYNSISIIENLPEGEDPDIFVAKNGVNALLSKERQLTAKEIELIWNKVKSNMKH
jgi:DNA primase